MLGVFEVTFDDEGNGVIKGFRALSDDGIKGTSYEVNDGEKYELLGNFDNPGTNYSNLVSLGLYEVEVDSNKDNRTTGFATVADLEAEYRIVDAFESRYELNEKNFADDIEVIRIPEILTTSRRNIRTATREYKSRPQGK